MMQRLRALRDDHAGFLLLFLLFVGFRIPALLLFRPGGFITDFSDYDFYYTWGTLGPMGYRAYDNLWTAYPPLFPALMLAVFELSARIPPWIEPRLWFHLLFGGVLLLFECGNLIAIYRLAGKLETAQAIPERSGWLSARLIPPLLYSLFFVPVYTMLGWFEAMPLFFLLVGLDLLLTGRWGWVASAVVAALGFLTKLTPILLVPVAVWVLVTKQEARSREQEGARTTGVGSGQSAVGSGEWRAERTSRFPLLASRFPLRAPRFMLPALVYGSLFAAVVIGVGYPFVRANPQLALSSFRVQSIRAPWQSVWALIDGFYGYGLVELDMRNLVGLQGPLWESRVPWTWVTLGFALVYLWLYTRPYDWSRVRTPIGFTAVSVIGLFLYSKGWSPQYLLWVLAFICLLLPTGRGVVLALALTLLNIIEADLFLILLPDAHGIMAYTVLARTVLLLLLGVEFAAQIWPNEVRGARVQRFAAAATWATLAATLVIGLAGAPGAARAYGERRLAEHPCREAVEFLRSEAAWPNRAIVSQQVEVWRDLYPWLRNEYSIHLLDGYSPIDRPAAEVALEQLDALAAQHEWGEFWWIDRSDVPYSGSSPAQVRDLYRARPSVQVLEERTLGACRLARMVDLSTASPLAIAEVAGGPIQLERAAWSVDETGGEMGGALHLVLYWRAETPVDASYTVFVHLLDGAGNLVAQQDNLPVMGMAPTNTWQPGIVVRDPFRLDLPGAGSYTLHVGLYDESGRRTLTLADGSAADHMTLPVLP
jgi:hypothetical protein